MLGIDYATKLWAISALKGKHYWPESGELLRFDYAENYHMAFSLSFLDMQWVNIMAIIASGIVVYYLWLYKDTHVLPSIGMSLIFAGAMGNLGERFIRGYVVDFISADWPDWLYFHRWPTFNIADSCVTVGITLFLIYTLFYEGKIVLNEGASEAETLRENE
jgi:signal peptidase II